MPRQITAKHPCACSCEEFWGLREDPGWDDFNAELDGQWFKTLSKEVRIENGEERVYRSHLMTHKVNPIPKALRHMLGKDEFVVTVHANWFKLLYAKEHSMSLVVQPPVRAVLVYSGQTVRTRNPRRKSIASQGMMRNEKQNVVQQDEMQREKTSRAQQRR